MLAKAGANAILTEYDDQGYIMALSFKMRIDGNDLGFRLPTDWRAVQSILTEQRQHNSRIKTDQQQAVNVAWPHYERLGRSTARNYPESYGSAASSFPAVHGNQ
jgi:hypothetical protein